MISLRMRVRGLHVLFDLLQIDVITGGSFFFSFSWLHLCTFLVKETDLKRKQALVEFNNV